jgi:hypothetical protein
VLIEVEGEHRSGRNSPRSLHSRAYRRSLGRGLAVLELEDQASEVHRARVEALTPERRVQVVSGHIRAGAGDSPAVGMTAETPAHSMRPGWLGLTQ